MAIKRYWTERDSRALHAFDMAAHLRDKERGSIEYPAKREVTTGKQPLNHSRPMHTTMILNLTQHAATAEQLAAGVVDMDAELRAQLTQLLTFDAIPSWLDVAKRAAQIVQLPGVSDYKNCMIGGAPFLMGPLSSALVRDGINPVYAFSERVSVESVGADGVVTKTSKFQHIGFVNLDP